MSRRIDARIVGAVVGIVVAVGFIVTAAVIVNNTPAPSTEVQLSEEERLRQEQDSSLATGLDLANKEASALLAEEPVDVNRVDQAYGDIKFHATAIEREDYLATILSDEANLFLSKGLKQEALNVLKSVDMDKLDVFAQKEMCDKIIGLANELGDGETVAKYNEILEKSNEERQQ